MDIAFLSLIIGYFGLMLVIGLVFYRKQKDASDFMLGSRSLNYWVTAISTHASDMSIWLFTAFPGLAYQSGLGSAFWIATGLLCGMYFTWTFIAKPLRLATEKYNSPTLASFYEKRLHDTQGTIRLLSALVTLVFYTIYISSGIVGIGRTMDIAFGIDYHTGIIGATIVICLYSMMGGFLAVAWNDFFRGMLVLGAIIGVPIAACFANGGLAETFTIISQQPNFLSIVPDFSLTTLGACILTALAWGLGYCGLPHTLSHFMGIDNVNDMKKARNMGIAWQAFSLAGAVFVGLTGIAYFIGAPLTQSESVFILLTRSLFSPFVAGLFLCGMLASAISAMDSQIITSASTIAEDIYKKFFKPTISGTQLLTISRLGTLLITSLALLLAFNSTKSIMNLVSLAWMGLGASFGPLTIASLYCKSLTKQGAIAGIVTGSVSAGIFLSGLTPISSDYALIPAFIISFVCIKVISKITHEHR